MKYLILISFIIATPLVDAAFEQTKSYVKYDGSYYEIDYPNGDIPRDIGVCTDVIIRAYRDCCDIDLQELVYEDMIYNNDLYDTPYEVDSNIDHRRVKNLRIFFNHNGFVKSNEDTFYAGDIVTWNLYNGTLPHIGIVSDTYTDDGTPLIIHNAGGGVVIEDILFKFDITGHYLYTGERTPFKQQTN